MVMMVVQVVAGIRLTRCDAVRRAVVVIVVVGVGAPDQVLETQPRRVGHLVQTASIHHRQWVEGREDLLI